MKENTSPTVIYSTLVGIFAALLIGRYLSFRNMEYSIGIYTGKTPHTIRQWHPKGNPVLKASQVKDVKADFVADPFMVKEKNMWYMFMEVLNHKSDQGDIGLAMSSDGCHWKYKQIVLDERFHLSYPTVFKWNSSYYMIPETHEVRAVRLYKGNSFPTKWTYVKTLIKGRAYVDPSIFKYGGRWWLFVGAGKGKLKLFYAKTPLGPWIEHPESPLYVNNTDSARPGGRVVVDHRNVYRYTQDDHPSYGNQVRVFVITRLTTTDYNEKVVSHFKLDADGKGWNARGMHHIDLHHIEKKKWIAAVDGRGWIQ